MYGFVNRRWMKMIDVMLEKKKGVRYIHMLRIIGLLEADFNTALKIYARRLMQQAEENGLTDEQWGGRNNCSSVDAAMIRKCTYENSRTMCKPMGELSYDCKVCFDRMYPETSNSLAWRQGMRKRLLEARCLIVDGLE